ncbi:F0F1-type ATP synthase delta subunit [Neisseria sp. HSC-16F19]|nr:hypothetical protein [Neisseria sp. HSC-16F19]MCP2040469.1 F0F1-type ATP synthase delta subunit [Neisseria sp. HSC-16F19]
METLTPLLQQKIRHSDYADMIARTAAQLSRSEQDLLAEIVTAFDFDAVQAQALAQAVLQQSRFDPFALHIEEDEEDFTGICPHCLNPPVPPLRDYQMWRQQA